MCVKGGVFSWMTYPSLRPPTSSPRLATLAPAKLAAYFFFSSFFILLLLCFLMRLCLLSSRVLFLEKTKINDMTSLANAIRVLLQPFHIKLGLAKNFAKSLNTVCDWLNILKYHDTKSRICWSTDKELTNGIHLTNFLNKVKQIALESLTNFIRNFPCNDKLPDNVQLVEDMPQASNQTEINMLLSDMSSISFGFLFDKSW